MTTPLAEELAAWIAEGRCRIGEVRIEPVGTGFRLTHAGDAAREDLELFTDPHDALAIARYDDAGNYRPLRSAPNLRHGWQLRLADVASLKLALDVLYPAALGNRRAFLARQLQPVPLSETLGRQTGMYRAARDLTDAQAGALVPELCAPANCLKVILWNLRPGTPIPGLPPCKTNAEPEASSTETIPVLCAEACNLLVAAARATVKKSA